MLWICQGIVVLIVVLLRDCWYQQLRSKTQRGWTLSVRILRGSGRLK